MKKIIVLLILANITISCVTTQNTATKSSATEYWNKMHDLTKVTYEGGDGKTVENAIIIKNAGNERNGVAAEYAYIAKINGEKFKDWKPVGQSTITKDNKKIDLINIQLIQKNETVSYYFDITEFYGKFN
ncbi:hypothetical protein [Flavobacterium sp.]|uniref:hypothetical protein n=1 Tax=Flavobacterium sp. TaxID=239 RepID=UPI00333E3942